MTRLRAAFAQLKYSSSGDGYNSLRRAGGGGRQSGDRAGKRCYELVSVGSQRVAQDGSAEGFDVDTLYGAVADTERCQVSSFVDK